MYLANLTTATLYKFSALIYFVFLSLFVSAQENSPYSRYGVGDVVPNQNILNRGMGGIAAGYSDFQSINFINPASLSSIRSTIFDLGAEINIRTLKSTSSTQRYSAANSLFSYFQLGFPLSSKKMEKKQIFWAASFGLRPVTRINYKIEKNERLSGIDSLNTIYEGSGGINQVNISTSLKYKNISFGISGGYSFGTKDYSTQLDFKNDSVIYYQSNTQTTTSFGGLFLTPGIQYDITTKNKSLIRLGLYANLQQTLSAKRDNLSEALYFGIRDTVELSSAQKGKIIIPALYGAGFTFTDKNNNWLVGADAEIRNWSNYRNYGQKDQVQNTWKFRAGAQYFPATNNTAAKKYASFVKYRAGLYVGPDYVKVDKSRMDYGFSLGAGLPLTSLQRIRYGDYVLLNTALEVGARGSNEKSINLRENTVRFSIGLSMNARWFQKRVYGE